MEEFKSDRPDSPVVALKMVDMKEGPEGSTIIVLENGKEIAAGLKFMMAHEPFTGEYFTFYREYEDCENTEDFEPVMIVKEVLLKHLRRSPKVSLILNT